MISFLNGSKNSWSYLGLCKNVKIARFLSVRREVKFQVFFLFYVDEIFSHDVLHKLTAVGLFR